MLGSRKDKSIGARALSSVASLMLIGSIVFVIIAGFNLYVTSILATGILGLAVPSVMSGENVLDMVIGFFEAFVEGIMEAVFGIFEAFTSIFG
ncbi:hypothetical protein DZA50_04875 [Kangiella sp. HD9-110m-PIT-SAG07]|nr:hypothetical protein DZA50_04875 [Kangiella sp. HD9-110m-PIT-SAG07]